jgi:hypothetical protein
MIGNTLIGAPTLVRFLHIMKGMYPPRPELSDLHQTGYLREKVPHSRLRRERIALFLHFYSLGFAAHLTNELEKQRSTPLLSILCMTPRLHATDPRDKLYGLLGVTSSNAVVNYSKTPIQLYTEFASAHLFDKRDPTFQNCSVFQISGISLWATSNEHGPSWVLFWPAFSHEGYIWTMQLAHRSGQFLTNRDAPPSGLAIRSGNILGLTAIICDSIEYVAPQKEPNDTRENGCEHFIMDLLCEAAKGCFELAEEQFGIFLRCLMEDYNHEHGTRLKGDELQAIADVLIPHFIEITKHTPAEVPAWMLYRSQNPVENATDTSMNLLPRDNATTCKHTLPYCPVCTRVTPHMLPSSRHIQHRKRR